MNNQDQIVEQHDKQFSAEAHRSFIKGLMEERKEKPPIYWPSSGSFIYRIYYFIRTFFIEFSKNMQLLPPQNQMQETINNRNLFKAYDRLYAQDIANFRTHHKR